MEPVDVIIEEGDAQTTLTFRSAEEARAALASRGINWPEAALEPASTPMRYHEVCSYASEGAALEFVFAAETPLRGATAAAWLADVLAKVTGDEFTDGWWHFVWSSDGCVIKAAVWFQSAVTGICKKYPVLEIARVARQTLLCEELRQVVLLAVSAVSKEQHLALLADADASADSDTRELLEHVGMLTRRVGISRCPISFSTAHYTSSAFLVRMAWPEGNSASDLQAAKKWVRRALKRLSAGRAGSWRCEVQPLHPSETTIKGIAVRACFCSEISTLKVSKFPLCVEQLGRDAFRASDAVLALRRADFPDALKGVVAMGVSSIHPF